MTLYNRIQQAIVKFVARQITLKEFRDQFVPLFLSIDRKSDADAIFLSDNVENLYADVLAGVLNETKFRQALLQLTPIVITEVVTTESKFEWALNPSGASSPLGMELATGVKPTAPQTSSEIQILEYA